MFTPSKGSEDAVKCPLCEYDVEEWDEDDDPMYVVFRVYTMREKRRRRS